LAIFFKRVADPKVVLAAGFLKIWFGGHELAEIKSIRPKPDLIECPLEHELDHLVIKSRLPNIVSEQLLLVLLLVVHTANGVLNVEVALLLGIASVRRLLNPRDAVLNEAYDLINSSVVPFIREHFREINLQAILDLIEGRIKLNKANEIGSRV